jgi:hypothetical protein
MREDAAEQYLSYKLIDSNQDWKAKWFYVTNHHPELPKPSGKQPKHRPWWNSEPTMQEGLQLPELLAKIKVLREAGLRAEHVAFSFMKRRVQPLMARDTLGYEYTGDDDTSRMRRHCRSASSCGRGSAALDCLISLSFRIRRLAWRLVCPRR